MNKNITNLITLLDIFQKNELKKNDTTNTRRRVIKIRRWDIHIHMYDLSFHHIHSYMFLYIFLLRFLH